METSLSPEFKIGIIGFGEMGKRHALEYHEATQGKLIFTAVVEPEEKRYEEGCEWYGRKPRRYCSIRDMLDKETLHGLIIANPNCFHYESLNECIGSGLPLLLEKPLESTFEKICGITRLGVKYDRPIMVDHVMRYAPIIQKAKKIISAGGIGKVCSFNFVQYHDGQSLFTTFRRTKAGGGGQLVEKATHDFDVAFYLCGAAPQKVTGISRLQKFGGKQSKDLTCSSCDDFNCPNRLSIPASRDHKLKDTSLSRDLCPFSEVVDSYDNETCLLECTDGVFGIYSHCFFVKNHFSRRYEIIGTKGVLYIELTLREKVDNCDGRIILASSDSNLHNPYNEEHKFNYDGRIHYNGGPCAARHFYDIIRNNTEPFSALGEAFVAEMVGIAAMKSSEENRKIDIERDIIPADLLPVFRAAYRNSVELT